MQVTVTCEECKKTFLVGATELKTAPINIENEELILSYYTCPHCHKLHSVSVDNSESLKLMDVLKRSVGRANAQRQDKGRVKKETINMINKNKNKLQKTRDLINKKHNGHVYQFGGQEHKLEICVPAQ